MKRALRPVHSEDHLPAALLAFERPILEASDLLEKGQGNASDRAVSLLRDDEFGLALNVLLILVVVHVVFLAPEKSDEIGILFDGARFAQIAQARLALAVARTSFGIAIELGKNNDGHTQFFCQRLDTR